jgi:hypothetical protein
MRPTSGVGQGPEQGQLGGMPFQRGSLGAINASGAGMTHRRQGIPGSKKQKACAGWSTTGFCDWFTAYLRRPSFWISAV